MSSMQKNLEADKIEELTQSSFASPYSTKSVQNEDNDIKHSDSDSILDTEQLIQNSLNLTKNSNQNKVSTCNIRGVTVVSLLIDGKERLCLAQISNTLLKKYSYNERHNRRVALGIKTYWSNADFIKTLWYDYKA